MKETLAAVLLCVGSPSAQPPPQSAIATDTLVVRGRCVDAASGEPLARCRVELTGHQSTGYPLAWSRADWADPPEITTGADGTFRFDLRLSAPDEAADRGRFHVTIRHAHHVGCFSHCAFPVAIAAGGVDYGDLRLPRGVRPRIRCVDPSGAPQANVLVDLRFVADGPSTVAWVQAEGDGPHSSIRRYAYQTTETDGTVHLEDPLPPGEYSLALPKRKQLSDLARVTLPAEAPITIVVAPIDRANAISGKLVDADGQAVEGAHISDGEDGPVSCVTRRDGTFTLVAGDKARGPSASLYMAQNRRYDGWLALDSVPWGQHQIVLEVPAKSLHTFVVRKPDGEPVEAFNLYCRSPRRGVGTSLRRSGTFAGGRTTAHVAAGEYELLVVPRVAALGSSGWQPCTVGAGEPETVVVVPRTSARTVAVGFADRAAAAGANVEVVVGGAPDVGTWVAPATALEPAGRDTMRVVALAVTDAQGRAVVQLREPGPAFVRVSGPGLQPRVVPIDFAAGDPAPIAVERGATLEGSAVGLRELVDEGQSRSIYGYLDVTRVTLLLVSPDASQRREGVRLDAQGRFVCHGLPPGRVEVHLQRPRRGDTPASGPSPVGTFTVELARPTVVTLELPAAAGRRR